MSSDRSDQSLIAACLEGSEKAWSTLVDRHNRLVYSVARRYGFDSADAEDVMQGVFLALYRRMESLRDHERLASWLITATHRECWRVARRAKRAGIAAELPDLPDAVDEANAMRLERQHLIRQGLAELGDPCAPLLQALFLSSANPDYRAIADEMGMKVGSIGPTRARCLRKLDKILRRMGLGDEPFPTSNDT